MSDGEGLEYLQVGAELPYYAYQKRLKSEKIPYYESWVGEEELALVMEVIRDNWISEGPKTREFERRLAEFCGVRHCLALCNATAGLIIGQKAIGLGPGDEVIAPAFTFIASVNSIVLAGATPVLVDVDARTLTIDPEAVEKAITPRTKAILPVHIYGHAADMDRLCEIARKRRLFIVEDSAQALGVEFKGKRAGSFGDVSVLSFFPDKAITLGEGGVVMTSSDELQRKLLMWKNDGRLERGMYLHDLVCYNFRTTDLQTAVGLGQLKRLPEILAGKRRNLELYRKHLSGVKGVEFPSEDPRCHIVPHRSNIYVDDPQALSDHLAQYGVGCRRFYYPVNRQPCYNVSGSFPNTENAYEKGLSLPSAPTLSEDKIAFVAEKIKEFNRNRR